MNRSAWVLGVGVAGLSVLALLLARQNGALRAQVAERDRLLAGRAAEEGLKPGDRVGEIGFFDASGVVGALSFGEGDAPVLLFVVSAGCDACDLVLPAWEALVGGGVMGARVVCVDAAAGDAAALESKSAVIPVYGSGEPGWLREVPITPTAMVVRGDGLVMGVWHGHRAARRIEEIRGVLHDAALGG